MDIVKQRKIREWTLIILVGMTAVIANLPQEILNRLGMDRGLFMAILGLLVVLALFLYVRFFFFLLYTLLAVGANLPDQWADSLSISKGPLLATLISMVAISLLNYSIKILPSGLAPKPKKKNPDAIQVLLNAIERGNPSYVRSVLRMDFDVNLVGANGHTPLTRAAQRGDTVIVDLLIGYGADPSMEGADGSPAHIARSAGHSALAARLEELSVAARIKNAAAEDPSQAAALG